MLYNYKMKLFFIIIFLIFSNYCCAYEDVPSNIHDLGINVQYFNENNVEINTDKMKKSDKIKKAGNFFGNNSNPKIKFDSKQINYQRALDYTTRNNINNTLLPRF